MDGIHDLGGRQGFGPIHVEPDQRPFPERWEGAVFTMLNALVASGAVRNADQFRHAIERIDPACYLTDSYYGRWLGGLETIVEEAGLVSRAAVNERAASFGAGSDDPVAARPDPQAVLPPAQDDAMARAARPATAAPLFQLGDSVCTTRHGVPGHTRLPAYARGVAGTVVAWHGAWVYPDTNAHGLGEQPQHLYTVAFSGTQLWGPDGEADFDVRLDLFEPYLSKESI